MRRTCNETKPATEFYRYTYSKDGLYQQCKICHAQAGQSRLQRAPPMEGKVRPCGSGSVSGSPPPSRSGAFGLAPGAAF